MPGMSGLTFFRHCPACGKRFEIRLVKKELEKDEAHPEDIPRASAPNLTGPAAGMGAFTFVPVVLDENMPSMVDNEEFDYTYKCKHCGHTWTEVREKAQVEREPSGYTGD